MFWKMGASFQVMVRVATQVGDFMNMVTRGKCERFKKKHLGLLLEKKDKSKKREKNLNGCHNPSLGLATKAMAYKVASQEEA